MYRQIIFKIKNEIEKFKLQGIELEDQRKRILGELEEKQTVASQEADEYEKKCTEISKIIDQLKQGEWVFMPPPYHFLCRLLFIILKYQQPICRTLWNDVWFSKIREIT